MRAHAHRYGSGYTNKYALVSVCVVQVNMCIGVYACTWEHR